MAIDSEIAPHAIIGARGMLERKKIAFLFAAMTVAGPASAEDVSISGVWRAVEGSPSGINQPGASDVQTLTLTPDGRYRRTIVVEGGNGIVGASGTFVDSGAYQFSPPSTFRYFRESYVLCTAITCQLYPAPPPNQGSLPFQLMENGRASFLGLAWTRIQ